MELLLEPISRVVDLDHSFHRLFDHPPRDLVFFPYAELARNDEIDSFCGIVFPVNGSSFGEIFYLGVAKELFYLRLRPNVLDEVDAFHVPVGLNLDGLPSFESK